MDEIWENHMLAYFIDKIMKSDSSFGSLLFPMFLPLFKTTGPFVSSFIFSFSMGKKKKTCTILLGRARMQLKTNM